MNELLPTDFDLIQKAKEVIIKNYDGVNFRHTVGCALQCTNGNIYLGVNVYLNHGACAEIIAIGAAITNGEREFQTIVAVKADGNILPPCGNCRQMLYDYAPDCDVIIENDDGIHKIKATELIPHPYIRKS